TLVEEQLPLAVRLLDDLDELVARLALVDQSALRLEDAGRDEEERGQRRRQGEPPAAEQERAAEADHGRACDQRPLGADRRDQDERGKERPEQAADRRDGVEAARDSAGALHVR